MYMGKQHFMFYWDMARNFKTFSSINSSFYFFKKRKKQHNKELQLNRSFFTFKKFDLPII